MLREIPIYKAEADAGLSEVIKAEENRAIATSCPILLDKEVVSSVKDKTRAKNTDALKQALAEEGEQFDLHYIYTILSTTGWNKNDDVFDRYEMWSARNTAEDKPFNKGHDPNNIIGHITGNAVVDENYELVSNNSEVDSLPDKFHILTSAVIYKHISSRDEKLTSETKGLLQEIAEGKWFVSMEALFSNFDYALVSADGKQNVVSRNEDTAFLSKHLRSYGGAGEFEGYRVGRLMRNLTFSGKGLVENPGNPESIIFKQEDSLIFKGLAKSNSEINVLVTSSSKGESSMSDNNEHIQSLKAQVETLEARLKDMDEEKVQAQISELEKSCADKDAEITELTSKLAEADEANQDVAKTLEGAEEAKAERDKAIEELSAKLSNIEAENLKTSRVSVLVDKGVEKTEAETLVDTFAGISDEQFETLVLKLTESAFPFNKDKEEDDKKKKKGKDKEKDAEAGNMKKKYAGKADEEDSEVEELAEAAEEAEDAQALENVEAEEAPTLAAQSEDESHSVMAGLQDYFGGVLGGTNNKNES